MVEYTCHTCKKTELTDDDQPHVCCDAPMHARELKVFIYCPELGQRRCTEICEAWCYNKELEDWQQAECRRVCESYQEHLGTPEEPDTGEEEAEDA